MAKALILDSEGLNALATSEQRGVAAARARGMLRLAYEDNLSVAVPAPVLAEVCRGLKRDAAVFRVLNGHGISVIELRAAVARRAGTLLERAKLGSSHAIDAFVVATALEFELATIATGDPKDLARLAVGFRQVRILGL